MRVKRRGAVGEAVDAWGTRDVEISAPCFPFNIQTFKQRVGRGKGGQIASEEKLSDTGGMLELF